MTVDEHVQDDIMRKTLDYYHKENHIIFAHVLRRDVPGVPGEVEYYCSFMVDTPGVDPSSASCVMGSSPVFDNYDDAVIHLNKRIREWVERKDDVDYV